MLACEEGPLKMQKGAAHTGEKWISPWRERPRQERRVCPISPAQVA